MKRFLSKLLIFMLFLTVGFGWSPPASYAGDYYDNMAPTVTIGGDNITRKGTDYIYTVSADTTEVTLRIDSVYNIRYDTEPDYHIGSFTTTVEVINDYNFYSIYINDGGLTVQYFIDVKKQSPVVVDPSGGSSGGGGGGSSTTTTPIVDTTIDQTTNTVVVSVSETQLASLFEMLQSDQSQVKLAVINIPKVAGLEKYGIQLPISAFTASNSSGIRLETNIGSLTLMDTMLQDVANAKNAQNVKFNMGYVDTTTLSAENQSTIGNHPIISLNMELDGVASEWNNPNSPVIVSVPYTPTAEELLNPEKIIIYYIDGQGVLNAIPNATYDVTNKCMVFTTTHFSNYAISYGSKTFTDITDPVVKHDVEVLASKGVINGKTATEFKPKDTITRAEFITIVSRAFEFKSPFTNVFTDVSSDKYYYNPVGMANAIGVINGIGDNKFDPNGTLNKEQIEIIVENLSNAKIINIDDTTLMSIMNGVDKATRDEVAVLIYNLM